MKLFGCVVHREDKVLETHTLHLEEVWADRSDEAAEKAIARHRDVQGTAWCRTVVEAPVRHGVTPPEAPEPIRIRGRGDELARSVFARDARRRQDQHASAA